LPEKIVAAIQARISRIGENDPIDGVGIETVYVNGSPGVLRAVEIPQKLQQLPIVRRANARTRPAYGLMYPLVRRVEVKRQEMCEGKIRNPV
jgi:hypothetical protein